MARRRFQEGQVYKRGKSWIGRWREDILLPSGSVRRIRRARAIGSLREFPTKPLAKRKLQLLLASVNDPAYRPGRIATLGEFVQHWKSEVLSQSKPSTIKAANSHLRVHILPVLGNLRLEQIGGEVQQTFVSRISRHVSRKTLLNVLSTLSAILNKAREWRYVTEVLNFQSLALPAGKAKGSARFFTAEQVRAIIAAAEEPFTTIFAVAAMTALRAGELLALKVDDVNLDGGVLQVRRSVWNRKFQLPKSASSERTIPIPDLLVARLRIYLRDVWTPNASGLLFVTRNANPFGSTNIVQRKLWPILDRLKIPRCGLHAFRHTLSSLLVESGAPVSVAQAQLGHADPRVTLGIYSHVVGDSHRRAIEKVADILDYNGLQTEDGSELIQ
jgi:integrase